jgi:hypothetical protein
MQPKHGATGTWVIAILAKALLDVSVSPRWSYGHHCGRRAAILYCADDLFACRQCYGLSYASQQQSALHRGSKQARKIRMRLGGNADLLAPFSGRQGNAKAHF